MYDALGFAHDIYRKTLTANRVALYPSTIGKIVIDWGRGVSPKYGAHFDTVLRWMIVEGRYYLRSTFATCGRAMFDPVRLDMCASCPSFFFLPIFDTIFLLLHHIAVPFLAALSRAVLHISTSCAARLFRCVSGLQCY